MRGSTAAEMLALVQTGKDEASDGAQVTVAAEVVEGTPHSGDRRAVKGILLGILLGICAWGAIWVVASALWHRH